jgi:hypothetical protein
MKLLLSCFVTDKAVYQGSRHLINTRIDIFKYMLYSLSVLNFDKVYIFAKLDTNYIMYQSEVNDLINKLFCNAFIYFDRFTSQEQWINSKILNNFNDDDIILFTQNDDHIFIDCDLKVINEGIELLKNSTNKFKSLYYSHFPEIVNLARKLQAHNISDNYYGLNVPITDSIQIVNAKYIKYLLLEYKWKHDHMIRIDELIRDTRIWQHQGTHVFNLDILTLVPKKEIFRHFDGYSHVSINDKICPHLKIPPKFFEKEINIIYCNIKYEIDCLNINPLKKLYIPGKSINYNEDTDCCFLLEDIPLFWKNHIKIIITEQELDFELLKKCRDKYYLDLEYCYHNNCWTNGICYKN